MKLDDKVDQVFCMEYIDKPTLKRMKLVGSGLNTPTTSSSQQTQVENELLENIKIMGAKIDDLNSRLVSVEKKIDDLSNKVHKSQRLKRKVIVHKSIAGETEE